MNFAFENIFGHFRSTLIGLVAMLVLLSFIWPLQVASMESVAPLLLVIIPFLLYGNNHNPGTPSLLIVAVVGLMLSSCAQKTVPAINQVKSDSTVIKITKTLTHSPKATVTAGVNLDSLVTVLQAHALQGRPGAPIYISKTDATGKAELRYWLDEFGRLQIACEKKDEFIKGQNQEIYRLQKENNSEIRNEIAGAKKYVDAVWRKIAFSLLGALLLSGLAFILFYHFRKNPPIIFQGNLSDNLAARYD